MEWLKIYSKKSFWIITIFTLFLAVGMNIGIYQGMEWLLTDLPKNLGDDIVTKNISWLLKNIDWASRHFYSWVVPVSSGIFLLLGWVLWLILKGSIVGSFTSFSGNIEDGQSKNKTRKDFVDHKIEQDRKRRLFLHTEGRLNYLFL